MLNGNFMTASVNIDKIDEKIKEAPILLANKSQSMKRVMTNSFGFGGTNSCIIFEKI